MAYCRWGGDSDVYLYPSGNDDGSDCFVCCVCRLRGDEESEVMYSYEDTYAHLEAHRANGDTVPEHAFDRLRDEMEGNRDW